MSAIEGEPCKRRRIEIGGENFYLVVGENFVFGTVPRENDVMQSRERQIVETLCGNITELMEAQG